MRGLAARASRGRARGSWPFLPRLITLRSGQCSPVSLTEPTSEVRWNAVAVPLGDAFGQSGAEFRNKLHCRAAIAPEAVYPLRRHRKDELRRPDTRSLHLR